jgi:type I restriction enzyme S subunit
MNTTSRTHPKAFAVHSDHLDTWDVRALGGGDGAPDPIPTLPKAFAVWFEDLDTWSVRSFFRINWQWPGDVVRPLGDALERKRDRVPPAEKSLDDLDLVTLRFDGSMEVRDTGTKSRFKGNLYYAEPGDVVYSKIDVRHGAIGVVPDDLGQVAVSSEFPVYAVRREVASPEYVKQIFRTKAFRALINSMISGASGRKRVKPVQIEALEVPFPSIATQRAIVQAWEAARREAAAMRAQADDAEAAIECDLLHRLGIPEKDPNALPKCFALFWEDLDRWSLDYLQRMKAGAGNIGRCRYPIVPLGDVTNIAYGITKNPSNRPGRNARPYLRVANVQAGTLDLDELKYLDVSEDELERYGLQRGDLLVCEGNSADLVGRPAIWNNEIEDCIHQNHVLRARPEPELVPEYALAYMQTVPASSYFRARAKFTTNLASINSTDLKELPIPLPPLDVQREIVERVRARRAQVRELRVEADAHEQAARERLQAMILGTVPPPPPEPQFMADLDPAVRAALNEAREALYALYGERLEGLWLFGSRARGEAHAESDVDVLVVLRDEEIKPVAEAERTSDIALDAAIEHDVALSLVHATAEAFHRRERALYRHIARDGVAL